MVPQSIKNRQEIPTNKNRNEVDIHEIKYKSVFERQLNAAKALANLLSIVKQATANRNAALLEIKKRT